MLFAKDAQNTLTFTYIRKYYLHSLSLFSCAFPFCPCCGCCQTVNRCFSFLFFFRVQRNNRLRKTSQAAVVNVFKMLTDSVLYLAADMWPTNETETNKSLIIPISMATSRTFVYLLFVTKIIYRHDTSHRNNTIPPQLHSHALAHTDSIQLVVGIRVRVYACACEC